jgi:hypothetical protein
MIARMMLQMFLPKRYQQLEVDLCRLALFANPELTMEKAIWLDSRTKLQYIESWARKQAEDSLLSKNNINVKVEPSLVENAGEGVFCIHGAKAGTLLCVHPGTIHSAKSIRTASEKQQGQLYERIFVKDLPHCVQLFDGTLIDAGIASEHEWQNHPFAVGHKCNHPPKGANPNVMKCPFWWAPEPPVNVPFPGFAISDESNQKSEEEDEGSLVERLGLIEKIRNEMGFSSQRNDNRIRGLGMVSTRNIAPGEELFVNYRYNPKITAPAWYHPVDVNEDDARWS